MTAPQLLRLMDKHQVSRHQLAAWLDISYKTLCKWIAQDRIPRVGAEAALFVFENLPDPDAAAARMLQELGVT